MDRLYVFEKHFKSEKKIQTRQMLVYTYLFLTLPCLLIGFITGGLF